MSRSGYSDDGEGETWQHIMYCGAIASAIRGKRGQQTLREIAAAMDAMPSKRLTTNELEKDGEFCTLGVLGQARGVDMKGVDPEDWEAVAKLFGIAPALVREIVWMNDESVGTHEWVDIEGPPRFCTLHPQRRQLIPDRQERIWKAMRKWVEDQIKKVGAA